MKYFLVLFLIVSNAFGASARVYQVDAKGSTQYNKSSSIVDGNKIYEVDPKGSIRYDKPHQEIKGNRVYDVSEKGSVRYDKPSLILRK